MGILHLKTFFDQFYHYLAIYTSVWKEIGLKSGGSAV
jgi:hypothetical protein